MNRDTVADVVLILVAVVVFLIVVAFLVGFGFEAVKWLGHTQQ